VLCSRDVGFARGAAIAGLAVMLAGCSSSAPFSSYSGHSREYFSERTYGAASPRVVTAGPMPRGGGHAVVGVAYNVAGKTYVPTESPRFSQVGLASWYGDAFHGRLTANGEVYDVNGLTAAHPTFPLPSYARVTDLENGRSIIVRINDRGPFASGRIIDVSERVAGILGFQGDGTAKVKVDYVGPARMDGLDDQMLLASYRAPNSGGAMFAWLHPDTTPAVAPVAAPPPVVLAAATAAPLPRVRPVYSYTGVAAAPPMVIDSTDNTPVNDDPLAPLIMRASMVSSFASPPPISTAQDAAADLAGGHALHADLSAAARRAAAQMDSHTVATATAAGVTVQLGAFGDPANASRIAASFAHFGSVDSQPAGGTRPLTVVRVVLKAGVSSAEVLAAAAATGLSGARVVSD